MTYAISFIPYEVEYDYKGYTFLVHFNMLGNIINAWKYDTDSGLEVASFLEGEEIIEAQEQVDMVLGEWEHERQIAKAFGRYNEDYS